MTEGREISDFLRVHLNRQLLRYEAGSAIFCPGCGVCMDCKKTIVATVHRTADGQEDCVAKYAMCGKCWAKAGEKVRAGFARASERHPEMRARLEIVAWKGMETREGASSSNEGGAK